MEYALYLGGISTSGFVRERAMNERDIFDKALTIVDPAERLPILSRPVKAMRA